MTRSDLIDMAVREAINVVGWFYRTDYGLLVKFDDGRVAAHVQSNWPRHLEAVKGRVG